MSEIKDRLISFLEEKEISKSEFGRRIGVSSAYVSSMRKSIQPDKAERIATEFPDLNISWLMTGKGNMYNEATPLSVKGDNNTQVAGNGNNIVSGHNKENIAAMASSLDKAMDEIAAQREMTKLALDEISAQRKLAQSAIDESSRLLTLIERMAKP